MPAGGEVLQRFEDAGVDHQHGGDAAQPVPAEAEPGQERSAGVGRCVIDVTTHDGADHVFGRQRIASPNLLLSWGRCLT